MTSARLLVGLLPFAASCGSPTFPLCDPSGAPACGNVGQVGRPAASTSVVRVPAGKPLLALGVNVGEVVQRPLLDADDRAAPGNCVGKCPRSRRFVLADKPAGGRDEPAAPTGAQLTGSRIVALGDDGALVIDADSGMLIRTDRDGRNVAYTSVGRDAGLLAHDPAREVTYVADRRGDRLVVVDAELAVVREWATPVEPYGVALSPDGATLLVTAIASRTLVAYDTERGNERWRVPLGSEPRGVAISPDGARALVADLATGAVDQVALAAPHRVERIALATSSSREREREDDRKRGQAHARAAFAVTYMGEHQAVVPFQREVPQPPDGVIAPQSTYGGVRSPVTHQLAFLDLRGRSQVSARIADQLPRAIVWDGVRDRLYFAGLGTDSIQMIENASQSTISAGREASLTREDEPRCGPDGLAVTAGGDVLVWCSFSRSVERLDFEGSKMTAGPSLIASALGVDEHRGKVLFHAATRELSGSGALACATCHPDDRSDGLSWSIDGHALQTPILAGRLAGTQPFHWDGRDATLADAIQSTAKRLGGGGKLEPKTVDALVAYLAQLPPIRVPARDPAAVARGEVLFESGCRECHAGTRYTDQNRHEFVGGVLATSDTPSLHAVGASAPYFHDGSASTLDDLLRDRGRVHGMIEATYSKQQRADLIVFLETR